MQLASIIGVEAIGVYQRYISPFKGYRCAHKALYSGTSCSEFAKLEILNNGIAKSIPFIKNRFLECRHAYTTLNIEKDLTQTLNEDKNEIPNKNQSDTCVNICTLPCL